MIKSLQKSADRKGFTLIELLVVIAIIGILASVILVGVASFRGKGRDARRIADIHSLANALELDFARQGFYPPTIAQLILDGPNIGVNTFPVDPNTQANYSYCVPPGPNPTKYALGATLEQQNSAIVDVARIQNAGGFPCQPTTPLLACSTTNTGLIYCATI